jgi:hypothetical protein
MISFMSLSMFVLGFTVTILVYDVYHTLNGFVKTLLLLHFELPVFYAALKTHSNSLNMFIKKMIFQSRAFRFIFMT